ncbi:MAG: hypothetical protein WBA74_25270, partial [Cyclobacteriaceae bacterium]
MNFLKLKAIVAFLMLSQCLLAQPRVEQYSAKLNMSEIRKQMGLPSAMMAASPFGGVPNYLSLVFVHPANSLVYSAMRFDEGPFGVSTYNPVSYVTSYLVKQKGVEDKMLVDTVVVLNNKVYVIFQEKLRSKDMLAVSVVEVDEKMKYVGAPKRLLTYKNLDKQKSNLRYNVSRDSSKLLIARVLYAKSNEPQSLDCSVFDNNFSEVWQSTIKTGFDAQDFFLKDMSIDNSGNLYIAALGDVDYKNKGFLFAYLWEDSQFLKQRLGPSDGEVVAMRLHMLNGDTPYAIAYHALKKQVSYIVGFVDKGEKEVKTLAVNPMSEKFADVV